MPVTNYMQTNFTAGQLSPRVYGRIDLDQYSDGAEAIHNFIVHPHGGVTRRAGTVFVETVKTQSAVSHIAPFKFNITQAYILEFGALYLRIFLNHGRLEIAGTPVEVVTPWAVVNLDQLTWIQSNDVLYLFHPNYETQKLSRTAATTWTLTALDTKDGPYLSTNQKNDGTIDVDLEVTTAAATGTGVALTSSADLFESTDVGRRVRLKVGSNDWGYGKIASYTNAQSVTWDIDSTTTATTSTTSWRLGLFSGTTGYPRTGSFFSQRLTLAGAASFPSTIALGVPGDFDNFQPTDLDDTVAADSGLTFTLDSDTVSAVYWLRAGKRLRIGTSDQEFTLWSGSNDETISPSKVKADRESDYGSLANLIPVLVGKNVVFVQRGGRRLREMLYVFEDDGFDANDLTLLAENITVTQIAEVVYAQNPDNLLWCRLTNGKIICMTYLKKQAVLAWHAHTLGGNFNGAHPWVESLAVIPEPNGEYDELWMSVKRTVNSATVRYIEYMEKVFDEDLELADARLLDSLLVYSGSATSTLSGLGHLEGETVKCVNDGVPLGDFVVASGAISLPRQVTSAYVGLHSDSYLRSLKYEGATRQGVAQGRLARAHRITIRLNRTSGGKIGYSSESTLESIFEKSATTPMGSPPPLFTGDKKVTFPQGHELGLQVYVVQQEPLPMSILSLMPALDVSEKEG